MPNLHAKSRSPSGAERGSAIRHAHVPDGTHKKPDIIFLPNPCRQKQGAELSYHVDLDPFSKNGQFKFFLQEPFIVRGPTPFLRLFLNFASGMIRDYAVGLFIHTLLSFTAVGQDVGAMPKLYPSNVTVYDIDRGMPISCLDNLFIDPRGRLFISPCKYLDIYQNLSFYQYDGDKSHIITMEMPDGKAAPGAWYLMGGTESGLLFGTGANRTLGFLYNPDNGSKQTVSFDSGESIRNMFAGPGKEVYILTYSPIGYTWYRLTLETQKLLARVPVSRESEATFLSTVPALRSGDQLWFLRADKGLVCYSLTDNSIKQYDWQELMGSTFRESPNTALTLDFTSLNMTVVPGGKLLFYFRSYGGFFVFDPQDEQVTR